MQSTSILYSYTSPINAEIMHLASSICCEGEWADQQWDMVMVSRILDSERDLSKVRISRLDSMTVTTGAAYLHPWVKRRAVSLVKIRLGLENYLVSLAGFQGGVLFRFFFRSRRRQEIEASTIRIRDSRNEVVNREDYLRCYSCSPSS